MRANTIHCHCNSRLHPSTWRTKKWTASSIAQLQSPRQILKRWTNLIPNPQAKVAKAKMKKDYGVIWLILMSLPRLSHCGISKVSITSAKTPKKRLYLCCAQCRLVCVRDWCKSEKKLEIHTLVEVNVWRMHVSIGLVILRVGIERGLFLYPCEWHPKLTHKVKYLFVNNFCDLEHWKALRNLGSIWRTHLTRANANQGHWYLCIFVFKLAALTVLTWSISIISNDHSASFILFSLSKRPQNVTRDVFLENDHPDIGVGLQICEGWHAYGTEAKYVHARGRRALRVRTRDPAKYGRQTSCKAKDVVWAAEGWPWLWSSGMRLNSHKPPFLLQMFGTDALFFVNLHTNVNNIRHQFVMKGCDIFNPGEFETSRQQQVDAGFAFPIFAVSKAIILHF